MAKRVRLTHTKKYMLQRERTTAAGRKGTFMGKWSPKTRGSAQARAGTKGASKSIQQFGKALKWLGGADRRKK